MLLYRTSNPKRRNSLSFLTSSGEQTALLKQLEKQSWVDEIFGRTLPIPEEYQSRFGPPGFSRNVFYSSAQRETSFFEFGYRLVRSNSVLGRGIAAVCFEIQFQGKKIPVDVGKAKNRAKILDPNSYSSAQAWVLSLPIFPESIQYPSVREPAGGINFAVYEPSAIATTHAEVEELILTPKPNLLVDIQNLASGSLQTIRPIT